MTLLEGDEIRITKTNGELDGSHGTVCGKVNEYPGGATYIVRLPEDVQRKMRKFGYRFSCVSIPAACLERV